MDWTTILLTAGTALGGGGSVFLWLETRGDIGRKRRKDAVSHVVAENITPLKADVTSLHSKIDHMNEYGDTRLKAALYEALEPVKGQITELNTKVEPLWQALVQGALHNAEILHHPHPDRAEMDELLDHFRENTMTPDEELRLRRFLVMIKNWEPGQDIGFHVYDSEPSAAAGLLSMLDLVRLYRERRKP